MQLRELFQNEHRQRTDIHNKAAIVLPGRKGAEANAPADATWLRRVGIVLEFQCGIVKQVSAPTSSFVGAGGCPCPITSPGVLPCLKMLAQKRPIKDATLWEVIGKAAHLRRVLGICARFVIGERERISLVHSASIGL